jgi:8-oxo-dGTP pyrophosphatase MutT (NUDIX family)
MSSDELVDVVDEDDRVVGQATRGVVRARRLRHRSSYVLLFNSDNRLFVHRRSAGKDIYPGCRDVTFGGVVAAGEDHDEAARRELEEEAGVKAAIRRVLDFRFDDESNHVNAVVYTATYDGALRLQASEIESGEWMDLDRVFELAQQEAFCPDGIEALCRYLDRLEELRRRQ